LLSGLKPYIEVLVAIFEAICCRVFIATIGSHPLILKANLQSVREHLAMLFPFLNWQKSETC
jgi:hypothetical protein